MSALRAVFVDTGAWVALRYRRDQYHGRAQKLAERLEHERLGLVTTESVLREAVTLLKAQVHPFIGTLAPCLASY